MVYINSLFIRPVHVLLGSFVCRTTYRWSDFTLSINKEGRNSWTWVKSVIAGSSLRYRRVFNAPNYCPRLLVLSRFSNFWLISLFIDNVKSYHLYVVWQTNDSNNTRLCCCLNRSRKYLCASVSENTRARVLEKILVRECWRKYSCASVGENTRARVSRSYSHTECFSWDEIVLALADSLPIKK